ncbi:glycosyltransferase family 2 protein [Gordonia paraffinivorans]|uniref:glycosyltransferase family 2 protein n=1 Tax=Gordonia paraffinivorans TaxID=175628 RepID=UPI003FCDE02E
MNLDFTVIIPHRDRGQDWRRPANLYSAVQWWAAHGIEPIVVSDGRTGTAQFNRSAAYNRGIRAADTNILVFSEADLLVPIDQIHEGVRLAAEKPGLVVPFSRFMAMTEADTNLVRGRRLHPANAEAHQVRGDRQSIGAVNIVTRESVAMIGRFDEQFEGHGYDDDATELAFRICCGPTRFVDGPGWHQHHLPGAFYATPESTAEDRAATERNRRRYNRYLRARTPDDIRALTTGGH